MRLTTLLSMAARVVVPKDYRFGTNRPWTPAAKRLNPPGKKRRKVFVEPLAPEDWSVLRGDTVSKSSEANHQNVLLSLDQLYSLESIKNVWMSALTWDSTWSKVEVKSLDGQFACVHVLWSSILQFWERLWLSTMSAGHDFIADVRT